MSFFTERADGLAALFVADLWYWLALIAMLIAVMASVFDFLNSRPLRGWVWALIGAALFLTASYVSRAEALSAVLVTGPE